MARLIAAEIPRLRRFALLMAHDSAFADDLVQESLLRAVSHFDRWEPGTNLRAWLLTILRNVFLTEVRRNRLGEVHRRRSETWAAAGLAHQHAQDFAIYLAAVQRAFDRLSAEHREIIALVALEELNYEEAASLLDLPIGTVRSRLSRARSALRQLMSAGSHAEGSKELRPSSAIDSRWRMHVPRS
jgi:RNA polymerase sigma-70 factor (ECF subfamily)